ncbi:MAG: ferrous iron transport protein A [Coriobacteriales bacterium]
MRLVELAVGQRAEVKGLEGQRMQRMKLLDMGLTPGTRVCIKKIAPMGDPVELSVRSYTLTLRKAEAALIEVEPVPLDGKPCAGCTEQECSAARMAHSLQGAL